MNKIASAIEKLERETGAVEILNVSTKFLRWLGQMNLDEAKRISGYFDAFIKDSIR